ncbi:MAG: hypothetical protein F6K18_10445 [Okeania sp. SIO2C2]|uniref:hypothetical protein n=1 Tax=Okeania sp. SIO2C2 TaxID=2607787 RepID=UPI0013B5D55A|nr:hypothetical protein [Okeania sp. SIO2C2]NEP87212.1 hypothetical protein [Okeania sp. SIO2C2]
MVQIELLTYVKEEVRSKKGFSFLPQKKNLVLSEFSAFDMSAKEAGRGSVCYHRRKNLPLSEFSAFDMFAPFASTAI